MNRGVIVLDRNELLEVGKYIKSIEKINIALGDIKDENSIFLNEDEMEYILDEIGYITDNSLIVSVREKISNLVREFSSL